MVHDTGFWKRLLLLGLEQDGLPWDWSTLALDKKLSASSGKVSAYVVAKSEGVWAASALLRCVAEFLPEESISRPSQNGPSITESFKVEEFLKNGDRYTPQDRLFRIEGPCGLIFGLERTVLNLASYACGIATATDRLVQKVKSVRTESLPRVAPTRKILPGYRDLAISSVLIGGGSPHRISLSGGVLLKENHIAVAGSVTQALALARETSPHSLALEIEVKNEEELIEAARAGADGVLLDNFSPTEIRSALVQISRLREAGIKDLRPWIEVSGGITEENILDYVIEGVRVLSVGGITHSVKSSDFSWLVERRS